MEYLKCCERGYTTQCLFPILKCESDTLSQHDTQNFTGYRLHEMTHQPRSEISPGEKVTQRVGLMESSWMLLVQSSRHGVGPVRFERGSWMLISLTSETDKRTATSTSPVRHDLHQDATPRWTQLDGIPRLERGSWGGCRTACAGMH